MALGIVDMIVISFIAFLIECTKSTLSFFAYCFVICGLKTLEIVIIKLMIKFGIVFARANTPISLELIKMFVINKIPRGN
jgi:hypothetical protein